MFFQAKKYFDSKLRIISDAALWNTTWLFIITGIIYLLLSLIDDRQVLGINTWLKPSKFAFSLASYTILLAYIIPLLDVSKRTVRWLSRLSVWFLIFEYFLISMQAARGVRSHFNSDTGFDILVYGLMGFSIVVALIPAIFITYYLFTKSKVKNKLYALALRYGMVILLLGSSYGGKVSSGEGRSVGAGDATSGIPYFNWSTEFGDLRVAHFLAIHAVHIFLLVAWALDSLHIKISKWILILVMTLYFLLTIGVMLMNEAGNSSLWFLT